MDPAQFHQAAKALVDICGTKTGTRPGGHGGIVRDLGKGVLWLSQHTSEGSMLIRVLPTHRQRKTSEPRYGQLQA